MAWMSSVKLISEADTMRALRYGYFWLGGGVFLLAVVLYLALAPIGTELILKSDKAAHFITFALLTIWFCGVFRLGRVPIVAIGLLAFGVLIELIQSRLAYRSAELADVVFDCLGILVGWGLAAAGFDRWTARIESWLPEKTS